MILEYSGEFSSLCQKEVERLESIKEIFRGKDRSEHGNL